MPRHRSPSLNRLGANRLDQWRRRFPTSSLVPLAHSPRRPYAVGWVGLATQPDAARSDGAVIAQPADEEDPRVRRMRAEAVLLISKTPLSPRKLAQLAHLADATEARTLVRQLNRVYDSHGRAIRIEQVAGGFRMLTLPSLAPWLARLGHLPPAVRLSTPMMETLAVVAYRQPVSRASAEAIRGVACGELLRQLMERDLIRIAGRSEELGRPYLYGTTKRFLQLFGLSSTDALPPIQWHTLQDDDDPVDLPLDDPSISTKEPVVSTLIAPAFGHTTLGQDVSSQLSVDGQLISNSTETNAVLVSEPETVADDNVKAIIEDEEDDQVFDDDDDDDDWDDDDDDEEDWDDDDDDEEDDDEDDDLDDDWEEVDDDDDDDDIEDADDEDSDDDDDDDEDWSEDSDNGDVDEDDDEEWD